ncbi:YbhB/YbcL family Raf kinase inhibitor-like protein [Corynebacterium aquilae]|uniref:Phospholipid-binding protein n=1 Tax=Corynebacterium aquilae DSM 44791 TaxID=1431546 RepID=A0A1L7CFZ9_9CORY|nr:YbhB/YbcL family Raf kinase inhibitor-like protein [Corynebacterium aquilae]APT84767.1 phospholipid-binding protein [Corynebacterium aquilae DSM 44791]
MSTAYNDPRFPGPDPYAPLKDLPEFTLTSSDLSNGERIPDAHAAPSNISPQLSWSDLPEGTKSLAVTCFDPDAPTAAGFWHWAAFNIPADVTELPTGAGDLADIDGAVVLKGDSGMADYYGPQPPAGHGPHRYLFAVHAVDVDSLDIPADATPTVLGFNLYFHSIARTILWGWYENN